MFTQQPVLLTRQAASFCTSCSFSPTADAFKAQENCITIIQSQVDKNMHDEGQVFIAENGMQFLGILEEAEWVSCGYCCVRIQYQPEV